MESNENEAVAEQIRETLQNAPDARKLADNRKLEFEVEGRSFTLTLTEPEEPGTVIPIKPEKVRASHRIKPEIVHASRNPNDTTEDYEHQREAIKRASNLLSVFSGIDRNMQMITALTLTNAMASIHREGGITTREIERELDMSAGAASRNVNYWMEGHRDSKVAGHGLIDWEIDPRDRRRRVLKLTRKGKDFMRVLTAIVDGNWWNKSQVE